MQNIRFFTLLALICLGSVNALAGETQFAGGTIISKDSADSSIALACQDQECRNAVFSVKIAGQPIRTTAYPIPTANDVKSFQERWGYFNSLSSEAGIHMPTFPTLRYLYLMQNSKTKYREGFQILEDSTKKDQKYILKGLYFRKLVEVILH